MSNILTSNQNNTQTVQLMDPSSTVNSVLNQYGYTLSYGDTERLKNLQPGQTITVYATGNRHGALLEVTYHGNGTYTIKSTTPLNVNNQWIDISQTVTSPKATITYSNNNIQAIATTGYTTTGNIYLKESGTPNSTTLATYNVNVSVPVTHQITNNEIRFNTGTPQVNTNLQSINVPTITSQQLQNNNNLQPGWYYNPETNQFIKLEYKTITQPVQLQTFGYSSLPENKLWYGYSSAPITNNQNVVNQPKIIQNWYADKYKEYAHLLTNSTPNTNINTYKSINEFIVGERYNMLKDQINSQTTYNYNIPTLESYRLASLTYVRNTMPGQTINYLDLPVAKYAQEKYLEESKPGALLTLGVLSLPFAIGTGATAVGANIATKIGTSLRFAAPVAKELAKEYAKNTVGFTLFNLGVNEAASRITTGKDLTPEQIKKIVGESIVFSTAFTTIGKGLSLASQPVLSTIIKQETSPTKAILAKSLYDVGSGFASGFGASLASQSFSKAMGWREDVNLNEALASGSLAGGAISAIRGFQILRAAKTGDYSAFATRIIPEKTQDLSITPFMFTKDGQIITKISGEAEGALQIGQKILTQKDISNIKPVKYNYLITERLTPSQIIQTTEGNIQKTTIIYEGEQIAQAGVKNIIGKIRGELESTFIPSENANFERYRLMTQTMLKDAMKKYPEFNQLQNVPKEGLQLFSSILEGKPIKAIENPHVQTINVHFPLSELQTGNVNLNKDVAGFIILRSRGSASYPRNEHYEYLKEGVGLAYYLEGNKNQIAQIITTKGVMRNQYGKGWFDVQQFVSTGSPEKGFNILGYGRSVDPNIKELASTKLIENIQKTNNIRNIQIGDQKQALAYSTMRVVPPYYNPKAPPSFGIPSLNIINVNQPLLPNVENIIKPQVDLERLKERFTQNIPGQNIVQTIQNIQQRIILPFQGLQSLQLNRVRLQDQLIDQQRIIARDKMLSYDVTTAILTIPTTNLGIKTIRIEPPPPKMPTSPPTEPKLVPIPPSSKPSVFSLPFLPPMIPRMGLSQTSPPIQLGNVRRLAWDIAYAFKKIWRQ